MSCVSSCDLKRSHNLCRTFWLPIQSHCRYVDVLLLTRLNEFLWWWLRTIYKVAANFHEYISTAVAGTFAAYHYFNWTNVLQPLRRWFLDGRLVGVMRKSGILLEFHFIGRDQEIFGDFKNNWDFLFYILVIFA